MTNFTSTTEPSVADAAEEIATADADRGKPRSAWRMLIPTLTPALAIGLILVGAIALFGIIGPFFVQDPDVIRNSGLAGPSADHILGTTQTGQDVFPQLS
jgi:peptide/nickel transport system permease protein